MRVSEQTIHLPAEPRSVTQGRHFVRDVLADWGLAELAEDAQLGTSELVANAIRHARTDLVLQVRVADLVTIAIQDGHPELRRPVGPETDDLAENGRGLHIVAAISQDWGITSAGDGKIVWFSLALPDRATVDADMFSLPDRKAAYGSSVAAHPASGHPASVHPASMHR